MRATENHPGLLSDATSAPESGRAIAYSTMFAYTGRYEVSEGSVTHHVDSAWNPNWVGTEQKHIFQIDGDPLILRTPRISSDGAHVFLELTWKPDAG
ncbi:MAG: lipocalin-like domain-containing protein [Alphaproteobacteria bacterium]|nr:lipocalin-like domain-containing protein [Alphaproteobacteria bacterium]MDP6238093.1 lipocalin-like domain-containing protein [Alphaproteobacteria bacterium]MDP7172172.1 lipocalin-like domain-containing protein [Alphaproteobacteria bacterium]MDP7234010.1 lipocalin-like domain-containing protein [Alphaproteobacteria bacterium]MDP7488090.1 lipocalin-like domain-containing protein [Alphaproteobacteria bacterium]